MRNTDHCTAFENIKGKPYILLFSSHYMEEKMIYDIEDFIQKARERTPARSEEPYDESAFKTYLRFSNLEEPENYYQQIKVCKAILNDIRYQSFYVLKMAKYCPKIDSLTIENIDRIRYNPERESYIIYAHSNQYEIYEDDVRFIYPSLVDVPDSFEYEVVLEDSSVYVYNRFTADPPFRVYGAEAAEE